MGQGQDEVLRCFVIADDYRWHFLTDSIQEFESKTKAYLELMSSSKKENQYYFKNVFLTRKEYLRTLKNIITHSPNVIRLSPSVPKKGPHLYLVDE